jgi:hypothetical protein
MLLFDCIVIRHSHAVAVTVLALLMRAESRLTTAVWQQRKQAHTFGLNS